MIFRAGLKGSTMKIVSGFCESGRRGWSDVRGEKSSGKYAERTATSRKMT